MNITTTTNYITTTNKDILYSRLFVTVYIAIGVIFMSSVIVASIIYCKHRIQQKGYVVHIGTNMDTDEEHYFLGDSEQNA